MSILVVIAGATGWAGSELARGIVASDDLSLVAGVSRTHAGKLLADVLHDPRLQVKLHASAPPAAVRASSFQLGRCRRPPARASRGKQFLEVELGMLDQRHGGAFGPSGITALDRQANGLVHRQ